MLKDQQGEKPHIWLIKGAYQSETAYPVQRKAVNGRTTDVKMSSWAWRSNREWSWSLITYKDHVKDWTGQDWTGRSPRCQARTCYLPDIGTVECKFYNIASVMVEASVNELSCAHVVRFWPIGQYGGLGRSGMFFVFLLAEFSFFFLSSSSRRVSGWVSVWVSERVYVRERSENWYRVIVRFYRGVLLPYPSVLTVNTLP